MRRIWKNYSLSIVLFALFMLSWGLQTHAGWKQFVSEQRQHRQTAEWFGQDGYAYAWLQDTMENWQSEFLQLLAFVVLSTYFIHRHSRQSRDGDDEMMQKIDRLEKMVRELRLNRAA